MVESFPEQRRLKLPEKVRDLTSKDSIKQSEITFLNTDQDGMTDPEPVEKVLLTSYPRCGNTMLRSVLEELTRIYTGSDCDLRRPMNKQLKDMGL
jgi:hypothetical protein